MATGSRAKQPAVRRPNPVTARPSASYEVEPPMPAGDPRLATAKLMQKRKSRKFVDIDIEGEVLRFYYLDLDWIPKSACISDATEMIPVTNDKGAVVGLNSKIHFDRFFMSCLRRMLIDPPIPLTDNLMEVLGQEAGAAFTEIMPDFFDTAQRVEAAKKKSATSSDETSTPEKMWSGSDDL